MTTAPRPAAAPARTVLDGFLATVARRPDAEALRTLDGDSLTWREYAAAVARAAGGLAAVGIGRGDRVGLMLRNRLEFHIADLAVVARGATPISIYNSSSPQQIRYLLGHCKAAAVITEGEDFLERMIAACHGGPLARRVIVVGDAPGGTTPWSEISHHTGSVDLAASAAAATPADLLTVIYTSGTTGPPKGVMLNHTNVLAASAGATHFLGRAHDDDRDLVSYLPMAHIAERMVSHYQHVLRGSRVTPCADVATLGDYLVAVRPHTLFGPPRVWEKLAAGIRATVASQGAEVAAGFADALRVGRQVQQLRAGGEEPTGELAAAWARADEDLLGAVRAAVGLDRCEIAFSGAAPVPAEVIDFLRDIGLPMSEVYGMSENCGGMTWEPYLVKPGRVGRAYPGTEVVTASDGEVLCRGPIVFSGYLDDPERTAEALDKDGWLHTGDIGEFDEDGYLRIIDRKKEILITAGGKNVSPANVEAVLKTIPLVGQAMAVGDGRPYLVALLTLDGDMVAGRYGDRPLPEVAADPAVLSEVAHGVAEVSERLSTVERVRRFVLLGEDWLPDSDLLTPTMKLKRRGVLARYAREIDTMYAGGGVDIAELSGRASVDMSRTS